MINIKYIRRRFRVLFSSNLHTEQTEDKAPAWVYSRLLSPGDLSVAVQDAAEKPRPAGAAAGHRAGRQVLPWLQGHTNYRAANDPSVFTITENCLLTGGPVCRCCGPGSWTRPPRSCCRGSWSPTTWTSGANQPWVSSQRGTGNAKFKFYSALTLSKVRINAMEAVWSAKILRAAVGYDH